MHTNLSAILLKFKFVVLAANLVHNGCRLYLVVVQLRASYVGLCARLSYGFTLIVDEVSPPARQFGISSRSRSSSRKYVYTTTFHATVSEGSIRHVPTSHVRVTAPELVVLPHKVSGAGS